MDSRWDLTQNRVRISAMAIAARARVRIVQQAEGWRSEIERIEQIESNSESKRKARTFKLDVSLHFERLSLQPVSLAAWLLHAIYVPYLTVYLGAFPPRKYVQTYLLGFWPLFICFKWNHHHCSGLNPASATSFYVGLAVVTHSGRILDLVIMKLSIFWFWITSRDACS